MDTGLEHGVGHEVESADSGIASRAGDDVRERMRARLAMANSQVLPLDESESVGPQKRALTPRAPKLVTTASAGSGSTLIRSPRPASGAATPAIDEPVEPNDIAHLFAEPIVWQESAADARRKLWGATPDLAEPAVVPDPLVLPDPSALADVVLAADGADVVAETPAVAPTLGAAADAGVAVTIEPSPDTITSPPPVVLTEPPVLLPPPVVPPSIVVEADPILVPIFVPELREGSPAETSDPVPEVLAEPTPAPTAAVPALVLPASVVPARAQTRAPLSPVADVTDFTGPSKNKGTKKVKAKPYRGQKRHPIRKFFGFLIVLALLGGAGYAGWYKYLRKAATWSSDLKPAAAFVEKTLHREFDKTVAVVTLDSAAYEAKLVTHVLGQLYANPTVGSDLGTGAAAVSGLEAGPVPQSYALRAVGLVGTDPPASIGGILAAHTTSFYSGPDHTIYRMDGTTAMFQIDMLRSLAAALIDQAVDTTGSYARISDASRTGLRGIVDAVANVVVVAKYNELPSLRPSREHELQTRLAALPDPATPLYLYPYLSSYEIGGLGYEVADPAKPLAGLVAPADDGALFDPSRSPSPAPEDATGSPSARTLGMEFWFDALTPTLGVDAARQAALLWTGDTSNPSETTGQACLSSTISTADATNQAALLAAMTQWVASRPVTSLASAAAAGTNGVTISMCSAIDVVEAVPTADAEPMGTLFVRADEERYVLGRAVQLGLPATPAARSCAVSAYRNGSINNVDPTAVDADTVAQITDVVTFCSAAG